MRSSSSKLVPLRSSSQRRAGGRRSSLRPSRRASQRTGGREQRLLAREDPRLKKVRRRRAHTRVDAPHEIQVYPVGSQLKWPPGRVRRASRQPGPGCPPGQPRRVISAQTRGVPARRSSQLVVVRRTFGTARPHPAIDAAPNALSSRTRILLAVSRWMVLWPTPARSLTLGAIQSVAGQTGSTGPIAGVVVLVLGSVRHLRGRDAAVGCGHH